MLVDTVLATDLRAALMRVAREIRAQRDATSLPLGQLTALGSLDRLGPLTPGELAMHERVQPPAMTRTVAALADAGLVTRTDHPSDGRQVLVSVSQAGQVLLRKERRRRDAWLARRMRDLPPEDIETLRLAAVVLARMADG